MPVPQNDPLQCGLAWAAKVCASGHFITGRDPSDVFRESCNWMAASDDVVRAAIEQRNPSGLLALQPTMSIDGAHAELELDGRVAHVRFTGDQGVVVVDGPDDDVEFEPTEIERTSTSTSFSLDVTDVRAEAGVTGGRASQIEDAVDHLFAERRQMTNAFVVLHRGQLIAEQYRAPFDASTRFESWSMGKTIASTLFGVAVRQGAVDIDDRGLFPEWLDDDRRDIRARDMLNMASGLRFSGSYGRTEDTSRKQQDGLFLDHVYVYAGGVDSHQFCIEKPRDEPPGQVGRYRNCDPLLTMGLLRERMVDGSIEAFLRWPYEQLLHRIGATNMVMETDRAGHFLISGHDYGTARDWARLGQLHLQRGAWDGEQLFDEDYAEFVRTPARHAWPPGHAYGGFCYSNADGIVDGLPTDAFFMSGGGKQRTVIVPSLDLVLVRLGHINGQGGRLDATMSTVFRSICEAVT